MSPVPTSPLTLLIIDDSAAVRAVVRSYFCSDERFAVVGEAADGPSGRSLAAQLCPSVIVLDQVMPGLCGTDVLPDIRRSCPLARIVVFSADCNSRLRDQVLELGGNACVNKTVSLDELADALSAA